MSDLGPRLPKRLKSRARELRKAAPIPERILWGMLRDRRLGGLKFRRQQVIGGCIADYYCAEARLIVELDGMSHVGQAERDDRRTRALEALGYRVIRVTNDDLLTDSEAVVVAIARAAGLEW